MSGRRHTIILLLRGHAIGPEDAWLDEREERQRARQEAEAHVREVEEKVAYYAEGRDIWTGRPLPAGTPLFVEPGHQEAAGRRYPQETRAAALALSAEGMPAPRVAGAVGVSATTVYHWRARARGTPCR